MKNVENEEVVDGLIPFELAEQPIWNGDIEDPIEPQENNEEAAEEENLENEVDVEENEPEVNELDEQAQAAFLLFKEFGVLNDDDIPETQNLDTLKETLSGYEEKVTTRIIEASSDDVQDVIQFALTKKNASRQDLIAYLQETTSDELPVVENADEAEAFLKAELALDKKKFKNTNALQTYLDSLEDDEKLEMAKEIIAEKEEVVAKQRKERIEQEKLAKEEALKAQQEYIANLDKEIASAGWDKNVQTRVKTTLSNLQTLNQAITSNPKIFAQYLNFLSTFDEKKGEFDTTKFALRASTEATRTLKNNIQADAVTSALTKLTKGKTNTTSGKVDRLRPVD